MTSWSDIKRAAREEELPQPIVAAEPMQIAFLDGLYGEKESLDVAFHWGTSIRMLYGGYRYSEDLDFCIPANRPPQWLDRLVQKAYERANGLLALYLGEAQTELRKKEGHKKIATWWFNAQPPGERQKYKVKIEFGTYPAYSKQPAPVKIRNALMPRQPMLISVSAEELLVDKVCAVADRPYTKERDFFDLWYLVTALNVRLDMGLLNKKIKDYSVNNAVHALGKRLEELNASNIGDNMTLFLPARYRRVLSSNSYKEVVDVSREVMSAVLNQLKKR